MTRYGAMEGFFTHGRLGPAFSEVEFVLVALKMREGQASNIALGGGKVMCCSRSVMTGPVIDNKREDAD